jgi:hypothetical protein
MSAQDDPDSTSAVTPSLLSNNFRVTARALDSQRRGQTARAARGDQLLMLRWLVGRPCVTGLALAAAGWAATVAAVIVGSHLGRGAALQIIFAATMSTAAIGETLLSPALPVIIDHQAPPVASGRYHRLGRLALVTGCILGPPVGGAALGADWGTTVLTTLAVACAVASIAAHRLGRQLAPGTSRLPGGRAHPAADDRTSRLKRSELPIIAAISQTTSGLGSRSVTVPAIRISPGPGDTGPAPARRPAASYRPEQLSPANRVPVRGSQAEAHHVQP